MTPSQLSTTGTSAGACPGQPAFDQMNNWQSAKVVTEHRAIVDTHRHPIGPKLAAKMAERGFYDPKREFPQTNAQDLIGYREFYDLDYAMPKQRDGGVTLSLASNGGEVDWLARDLLQVSTGEALKFLNDEYLEIRDRYPGEFALMANAHALEAGCRPVVEEMISQGGAKAIAVASSYGDGSERAFLDKSGLMGGVGNGARGDLPVGCRGPVHGPRCEIYPMIAGDATAQRSALSSGSPSAPACWARCSLMPRTGRTASPTLSTRSCTACWRAA